MSFSTSSLTMPGEALLPLGFPAASYWGYKSWCICILASLVAELVKNLPVMQETLFDPWLGTISLEKEMAAHSNMLTWEIPWTEEPGGLQSLALQKLDTTEQLNHRHHHTCTHGLLSIFLYLVFTALKVNHETLNILVKFKHQFWR